MGCFQNTPEVEWPRLLNRSEMIYNKMTEHCLSTLRSDFNMLRSNLCTLRPAVRMRRPGLSVAGVGGGDLHEFNHHYTYVAFDRNCTVVFVCLVLFFCFGKCHHNSPLQNEQRYVCGRPACMPNAASLIDPYARETFTVRSFPFILRWLANLMWLPCISNCFR